MSWKSEFDGRRGHCLMTKAIAKGLPGIGETDSGNDPFELEVGVKFFCPFGRYTFYVTEFDGEDRLFGYCVSPLGPDCDEWGYASLSELSETTIGNGIPAIERDGFFAGVTVRKALKQNGVTV